MNQQFTKDQAKKIEEHLTSVSIPVVNYQTNQIKIATVIQ